MASRLVLKIGIPSLVMVLLVSLMVAPMALAATTWSLTADYLARGNATAPVIDDAGGDSVWYLKTGSSATDPGTYVPFTTWATNYDSWMAPGAPPIKGWYSGTDPFDVPHTSVNNSGSNISCVGGAFTWLNGTVLTHPGLNPITFAVTEWRSPAAGVASISATLSDLHSQSGGNGFEYWVLQGSTVLSQAVVPEGGSAPPVSLAGIEVAEGDSLYLVVGPNGNYGGDTTQIEFSVTLEEEPPAISTFASAPWSIAVLAVFGLAVAAVAISRARRSEA